MFFPRRAICCCCCVCSHIIRRKSEAGDEEKKELLLCLLLPLLLPSLATSLFFLACDFLCFDHHRPHKIEFLAPPFFIDSERPGTTTRHDTIRYYNHNTRIVATMRNLLALRLTTSTAVALLCFLSASCSHAFVICPAAVQGGLLANTKISSSSSTRIFLEDWVADLIDDEVYRQSHKQDFEREWMEKNRQVMLHHMHSSTTHTTEFIMLPEQEQDFRQHARDQKLATKDPQKYCADRCLATGNCDVYEDL